MLLQILLLGASLLAVLYFRLARAIAYEGGVPCFGKPGVLGHIQAALRWTLDAEGLIIEGRKQFNNGPFVIPMLVSYLCQISDLTSLAETSVTEWQFIFSSAETSRTSPCCYGQHRASSVFLSSDCPCLNRV